MDKTEKRGKMDPAEVLSLLTIVREAAQHANLFANIIGDCMDRLKEINASYDPEPALVAPEKPVVDDSKPVPQKGDKEWRETSSESSDPAQTSRRPVVSAAEGYSPETQKTL